jgi:Tfp pilus assembly ATPase PilU
MLLQNILKQNDYTVEEKVKKLQNFIEKEKRSRAQKAADALWKLYEDGKIEQKEVKEICENHLSGYWDNNISVKYTPTKKKSVVKQVDEAKQAEQ